MQMVDNCSLKDVQNKRAVDSGSGGMFTELLPTGRLREAHQLRRD